MSRNIPKILAGKLQHFLSLPAAAKARWILVAAALGVAIFLIVSVKPWSMDLPEPGSASVRDFVRFYSWWGGLFVLVGILVMAGLAGWWTRPLPQQPLVNNEQEPFLRLRWFLPWVSGAMLITAVLGWQRLDFDLWDDEDYSLRRFVVGTYLPAEEGEGVRWNRVRWERTWHDYHIPNNHILHSVLARWATEIGGWFRRGADIPFSERDLRWPAYLFGILSVGSLALFLRDFGFARAGIFAAFFLALHPWHLRYASEARGYSLVLFLFPLLLIAWRRALSSLAWRWWVALAALGFGLLYTYPAALYPVAVAQLLALVLLLGRIPAGVSPGVPVARWFAANAFAGLLFVWLFLPCVPQLLAYLEATRSDSPLGRWWLEHFFSHLFAGVSWFKSRDLLSPQPELFAFVQAVHPLLFPVLKWVGLLFCLLGVIRFARRGPLAIGAVIVLILPGVLAYLAAQKGGTFLYEWYLLYVLAGAVGLFAVGLDSLSLLSRRLSWVLPTAIFALFLFGYLSLVRGAHLWLLTKPLQPMSESVLLTRPSTVPNYPGFEKIRTVSFNAPAYLYDPHVIRIRSMEDLLLELGRADRDEIPLYVNIGNPPAASHHHPDMFALLQDPTWFEPIGHLHGWDPTLDRKVFRYRTGALRQLERP